MCVVAIIERGHDGGEREQSQPLAELEFGTVDDIRIHPC
jgi:hypothetical protein